MILAPSVLSCDFGNLQRDIEMLNQSSADMIHVDVMDGVFVPNISIGVPVLKAIAKHASKPLDVHLMMVNPDRYIETFRKAGADIITVHYEACTHLDRVVNQIKATGAKAGVALNPHTPVASLENILSEVDLVLIMSVNPGFGGQKFIPYTIKKIEHLSALKLLTGSNALIEVDGGLNADNAIEPVRAGADILVLGSAIFSAPDPIEYMLRIKQNTNNDTGNNIA